MEIQSLEYARKFIDRFIKRNPNTRLKTIYKKLRTWQSLSYIGCWPLISEIVYRSAKVDKFYTPKEVVQTYKLSEDPYLRRQHSNSKLVMFLTNKDELRACLTGK